MQFIFTTYSCNDIEIVNDNVVERDSGVLRERFQVTLQHGDANTGININSSCQTAEIFIIDDDGM